jgi:hypothetical protein
MLNPKGEEDDGKQKIKEAKFNLWKNKINKGEEFKRGKGRGRKTTSNYIEIEVEQKISRNQTMTQMIKETKE